MAGKTDLDRDGQAGAGQAVTATREFRIAGLHCADCAETIEKNLAALPGVAEARVDYAIARLVVTHAPSLAAEEIARVVRGSGYEVAPVRGGRAPREERPFWVRNRQALLTAGAGSALAAGFGWAALVVYVATGLGSALAMAVLAARTADRAEAASAVVRRD